MFFFFWQAWRPISQLFLGTLSTATSVGITARILSEKRKLSTPEGVTILSGAVLDDVLGIVLLAVVAGISKVHLSGAPVDWRAVAWIAFKAFGFWLVCTALGILFTKRISSGLKWLRSNDAIAGVSLGLASFLAGLAEMTGYVWSGYHDLVNCQYYRSSYSDQKLSRRVWNEA